ncbi:MAG: curli assembly protein CsgF [Boseongicola sp.]
MSKLLATILLCSSPQISHADITYKPINPSFGGSSFNSAHLLGLANAQNVHKRKAAEAAAAQRRTSSTNRFLQLLQSRLYSSLAGQVSEAIFGENAQAEGRVKFQDQEVSWSNNGTEIVLVVNDLASGQISEIVIPTLTQ